jgi:putative membrane protein
MKKHQILFGLAFIGLVISGIAPKDYFTWSLEVLPGVVGMLILLFTYKRFRLTDLTYLMILIHCYILFLGGHYTYADVPLFDFIQETFGHSRNNYDKVGHFAQGFVPAFIIRELLVRKKVVLKRGWLAFLTISVCAAVSVFYEFIEWFVSEVVAKITGASADAFLGTQGYIWDTQSDMLFAVIGGTLMILVFSKLHDKHIKRVTEQGF